MSSDHIKEPPPTDLPNHEPEKLHSCAAVSGGLRVENVERQCRHEERRVDSGDVESGETSEVAELVRGRRVPPRRKAKELADEDHRIEVVLPDLEASSAKLSCDRLVVRMFIVVEVGRN